jgi:hypothetical protein
VLGGIFAGIVSNAVLTVVRFLIVLGWSFIVWVTLGQWRPDFARNILEELWVALKIAAFPFVGQRSLEGGFDMRIVTLGLMARVVFSICSGVLFGLLAHGRSRTTTFALGMLFAILYWAESSHLVTPPISDSLGRFIEFVPYGLALAVAFLWYQRRFSGDGRRW